MNLAVAGNQWITKYLIDRLIEVNLKPSLIINLDSNFKNISGYCDFSDGSPYISIYDEIKLYSPKSYSLKNDKELLSCDIDILLVFGWQRLIPEWLIDHCKLGAFGVHGSIHELPDGRGRAVFNWTLINECYDYYHTFKMYMLKLNKNIDDGEIVDKREFDLLETDNIKTLYHKNCIVSSDMFIENIPKIINSTVKYKEQPKRKKEKTLYYEKRTPEQSQINWENSAHSILYFIKALTDPYPNAFSYIKDNIIKIKKASGFDSRIKFKGNVGEVVDVFPDGEFLVITEEFPIYIEEYSYNGKIKKGDVLR